jgi:hypothetical protein
MCYCQAQHGELSGRYADSTAQHSSLQRDYAAALNTVQLLEQQAVTSQQYSEATAARYAANIEVQHTKAHKYDDTHCSVDTDRTCYRHVNAITPFQGWH